jgi:hypothetical protein
MLREEQKSPADYVILNVWSDDHFRSLHRWRWLHVARPAPSGGRLPEYAIDSVFGTMPWAHLRFDAETGAFEEIENPYAAPESRYLLCDRDHILEAFSDSLPIQALLASQGVAEVDKQALRRAAIALELRYDFSSPEATAETAQAVLQTVALRSSLTVLDKARAFAEEAGKRLIVLLSYSAEDIIRACYGQRRFDQDIVDYLRESAIPHVDTLDSHLRDFDLFGCTPEDYAERYYIGHYNPRGNHFFAFAIKDAIVSRLDPKPPSYRDEGPTRRGQGGGSDGE